MCWSGSSWLASRSHFPSQGASGYARNAVDAVDPGPPGERSAVAVKNLKTGESFSYHADEPMTTASLIKFPIMVEAYRQASRQEGRPGRPRHPDQGRQGPRVGDLDRALFPRRHLPAPRRRAPHDRLLGQHRDEPGDRSGSGIGRHRRPRWSGWATPTPRPTPRSTAATRRSTSNAASGSGSAAPRRNDMVHLL